MERGENRPAPVSALARPHYLSVGIPRPERAGKEKIACLAVRLVSPGRPAANPLVQCNEYRLAFGITVVGQPCLRRAVPAVMARRGLPSPRNTICLAHNKQGPPKPGGPLLLFPATIHPPMNPHSIDGQASLPVRPTSFSAVFQQPMVSHVRPAATCQIPAVVVRVDSAAAARWNCAFG